MPLDTSKKVPVTGASASKFKPLPKDVYQVELIDVESKPKKKFQSEEFEDGLSFTFAVIEETPNYGRKIWTNTNLKFSTGKKSSALFTVVCALSGKEYGPKDCENPEFVTAELLNSFIGKQLRLSIGQQPGTKDPSVVYNTIDAYLPVKEMLAKYDEEKAKKFANLRAEAEQDETPVPPQLQPEM